MAHDLDQARIFHGDEVAASESCGCFYCLATFPPSWIAEWTDVKDSRGKTALCPYCGIDAVIGSASGYPTRGAFLRRMYERWFNEPAHHDPPVGLPDEDMRSST